MARKRIFKLIHFASTAWGIGGIACMRRLHETAIANYVEHSSRSQSAHLRAMRFDGAVGDILHVPPVEIHDLGIRGGIGDDES